jgi:hypothetical protein
MSGRDVALNPDEQGRQFWTSVAEVDDVVMSKRRSGLRINAF